VDFVCGLLDFESVWDVKGGKFASRQNGRAWFLSKRTFNSLLPLLPCIINRRNFMVVILLGFWPAYSFLITSSMAYHNKHLARLWVYCNVIVQCSISPFKLHGQSTWVVGRRVVNSLQP
jgi:hypothetical protein